MIEFTPNEVRRMAKNPDVLRAVANDHDYCGLEADACDPVLYAGAIKFHTTRSLELNTEADRLDEQYGC
jgi:hypothetical protein